MIYYLLLIICSVLGGLTYRMGGSGNYPRFLRPLGIGLCSLAYLWHFSWIGAIISSGALAGLSTTYFKDKGTDADWYNWLFVGLAMSLAILPVIFLTGLWTGFILRTIICTAGITLWSQFVGNAVVEEFGRGFITIATLILINIRI